MPQYNSDLRIGTFNANSVRVRQQAILDWLEQYRPDVLALQETKVEDSRFPKMEFEALGWHVEAHGRKSYNGVALISREAPQDVSRGFGDEEFAEDCRVISAKYGDVTVVNTYVPNGSPLGTEKFSYKLRWLEKFKAYLEDRFSPKDRLIWLGDINIAPTPDDVFSSPRHLGRPGHHPEEFERLARIVEWGLADVFRKFHEGPGHYSFWEFFIPRSVQNNLGWRIDHIYATKPLAKLCTECEIDKAPRLNERPSDHTFVWADFEI